VEATEAEVEAEVADVEIVGNNGKTGSDGSDQVATAVNG
jgi:hypothetical protein